MAVRSNHARRDSISGEEARAQILDAAEELFYRRGARNVGIEAVIKLAGVNKMSLYRQFDSKEDLLQQYLARRDQKFWAFVDASLAKHPTEPRQQLRRLLADIAARAAGAGYRGCPFVNIAVEFPDRSHAARRAAAANKARLLRRLNRLARAAGALDAPFLAKSLALLIEGAFAASQTYGAGAALLAALPRAADALIGMQIAAPAGGTPPISDHSTH